MERAERENARKTQTFWGLGSKDCLLSPPPRDLLPRCSSVRAYVCLYDCSKPMNPRAGDRETKLPLTVVTRTAT